MVMSDKHHPTSYRWPVEIKELIVKLTGKRQMETGKPVTETDYLMHLIRQEAKRQGIQ